jgi:hypothetical protein
LSGQTANIGAVPVKFDAPHHHFDVWFAQTGCRALFARGYAFIAGFDTTFVVFRWHNVSPFCFVCFCISERRVRKISPLMLRRGVESCLSSHGLKPCLRVGRRDANQRCVHELRTEIAVSLAIGSKGSDRNLLIAEMSKSVQNSSVRACVPSAPCGEKRINQEEIDKLQAQIWKRTRVIP